MLWIKDNGQEIELNDREETTEKAIQMGWKLKQQEATNTNEPKKRGRPKQVK